MQMPGESVLIKLWETLAEKGVGKLLSPWQIRRDGRAHAQVRAEEMLLLAQAEADASDVRSGHKRLLNDGLRLKVSPNNAQMQSHEDGTFERHEPKLDLVSLSATAYQQNIAASVQAEINTCRAALFAEEALVNSNTPASPDPVDDDWLSTWRDHAGKVSSEYLQRLWGNVLAGEVIDPGRYSLRTLDFLRTLSKSEAELISLIGPIAIQSRLFIADLSYFDSRGLTSDKLFELQDLGILTGVGMALKVTCETVAPDRFLAVLPTGNRVLIIERDTPEPPLRISTFAISKLGSQILSLGNFSPDEDYLTWLGRKIVQQGFTVSIGDWTALPEGGGRYNNLRPILL